LPGADEQEKRFAERRWHSEILHHVVWYVLTTVSEELTATIIKAVSVIAP
jgi:hypothetical protein